MITICEGDIWYGPAVKKFNREIPSVITPSSVGVPVEMPKPL